MGEQLTIADVFERAADEIDGQANFFIVPTLDRVGGYDLGRKAYGFLRNWLEVPSITSWEDRHTQAETVAMLRRAAVAARGAA